MKRGPVMNSAHLREYQCPPDVFAELGAGLLRSGKSIRFIASGDSMLPNLRDGDTLICEPVENGWVSVGDIVFFLTPDRQAIFHRVVRRQTKEGSQFFQIQADNQLKPERWIRSDEILGKLTRVIRSGSTAQELRGWRMKLGNSWAAFRSRARLNRFNRVRMLEQYFSHIINR